MPVLGREIVWPWQWTRLTNTVMKFGGKKMMPWGKVDYEESTMSCGNEKKKQRCWEAKLYSYWMKILSYCREGEVKENLSFQKEAGEGFLSWLIYQVFIIHRTNSSIFSVTYWRIFFLMWSRKPQPRSQNTKPEDPF